MNAPHKIAAEIVEASGWPHGYHRVATNLDKANAVARDPDWFEADEPQRVLKLLIDASALGYGLREAGLYDPASEVGVVEQTYTHSRWNRGRVRVSAPSNGTCVVWQLWDRLHALRSKAIDARLVEEGLHPVAAEEWRHCEQSVGTAQSMNEWWPSVEDAFHAFASGSEQ